MLQAISAPITQKPTVLPKPKVAATPSTTRGMQVAIRQLVFGGSHLETDHLQSQVDIEAEAQRLQQESHIRWFDKYISIKIEPDTYLARARYNLTHDPAALAEFLPYRKKLAAAQSPDLAKYDTLVNRILKESEFYKISNYKDFRDKLRPLYRGNIERSAFYPVISFFKKLGIFLRALLTGRDNFRAYKTRYAEALQHRAKKIDNNALARVFSHSAKPLQDDSTRYMIAAGIAELLHQHPEYADTVLKANHGRPLRFVVSDKERLLGGQVNIGSNVIWINNHALWALGQKQMINHYQIAQHEFVHAMSEERGLTTLPMMSAEQRQRFERDRKSLLKKFDTNGLQCTRQSKTVFQHAMNDLMEFLPGTLDIFKHYPDQLRQNEAGKDLYNLYKEIFNIDPLKDMTDNGLGAESARSEQSSTHNNFGILWEELPSETAKRA